MVDAELGQALYDAGGEAPEDRPSAESSPEPPGVSDRVQEGFTQFFAEVTHKLPYKRLVSCGSLDQGRAVTVQIDPLSKGGSFMPQKLSRVFRSDAGPRVTSFGSVAEHLDRDPLAGLIGRSAGR